MPPAEVADVWMNVRKYVTKAVAEGNGEMTTDDVQELCQQGRWRLWLVVNDYSRRVVGFWAIEVVQYPRTRSAIVWMMSADDGGNVWLALVPQLEAWAKDQGCKAVEVFGRLGWERVLPGYRRTAVVLRKEL